MSKAGGILGIIAGIFGFVAAIVTLSLGGIGAAFNADKANTIVGLGYGGIIFSFAVIVCAAIAFAKPKGAGIALILCSILGAILGGTFVAICMVLSLVGGVLAVIGAKSDAPSNNQVVASQLTTISNPASPSSDTKKSRLWLYVIGTTAVALLLLIVLVAKTPKPDQLAESATVQPQPNATATTPAPVPSSDIATASAPSAESEIAAAKAVPKRNVAGVTLQAFECGDTCQLKYVDSNGNSQSAICTDTKGCQSWAEGPKGFMPLIGAKADLVIGKKYIAEGGVTMDNVEAIDLAKPATTPAPVAAAVAPISAVASPNSPLCKTGESTAFACSTGKKDVALCAIGGTQNSTVQLTYRIAPVGQSTSEMVYPEQSTVAKTVFKGGSQTFAGDKSMVFLSFDKGALRYVIYSAEGKGLDKAGVVVEQAGKRVANLACTNAVIGEWSSIVGAGLPTDSRGFEMP